MTDKEKIRTEDLEKAAEQFAWSHSHIAINKKTYEREGIPSIVNTMMIPIADEVKDAVIYGGKWQKEQMIEKVCEWLMSQSCCGYIDDVEVDEFINRFTKAMGKKINMCGECKWFSCDDRGRCICTKKEWGNWKASPNVCACINFFERKEEEK